MDLRNSSVIMVRICKNVEAVKKKKKDHSSKKFGSKDKGRQIKGSSNFLGQWCDHIFN